jgi:signal transduction histidine kinase
LRAPGPAGLGLQLEEVDLLAEAKQTGRRVTLVSGRRVNVDPVGDGPFTLRADRSRVEQVIQNLLNNAVKFSPADSEIDVEVDRGEHEVILAVTDRGAGIPAEELDRIFERYYRGSNQRAVVPGEGIGLAIAREIVAAHGGRIWAASEGPGHGSTLFVALPISPPAEIQPLESGGAAGARAEAAHQA